MIHSVLRFYPILITRIVQQSLSVLVSSLIDGIRVGSFILSVSQTQTNGIGL